MDTALKYKDAIIQEIDSYALDPTAIFIGYNTVKGSRLYGTLNNVPVKQCLETPVCENLMVSLAIGMALEGYKPVVCFERHDFLLLGLDALVNHVDKMPWLSGDQFKLPIIIRAVVGAKNPLNPGPQHTGDYTIALRNMLKHTDIFCPFYWGREWLSKAWGYVGKSDSGAVVIIEERDLYEQEIK